MLGFASLGPSRDEHGVGELYAIYVDPDEWSRGAGRALIERAEERLAEEYAEATLWVLEDNPRARRFYEAAGWQPDGARQSVERLGVVTARGAVPEAAAPRRAESRRTPIAAPARLSFSDSNSLHLRNCPFWTGVELLLRFCHTLRIAPAISDPYDRTAIEKDRFVSDARSSFGYSKRKGVCT